METTKGTAGGPKLGEKLLETQTNEEPVVLATLNEADIADIVADIVELKIKHGTYKNPIKVNVVNDRTGKQEVTWDGPLTDIGFVGYPYVSSIFVPDVTSPTTKVFEGYELNSADGLENIPIMKIADVPTIHCIAVVRTDAYTIVRAPVQDKLNIKVKSNG